MVLIFLVLPISPVLLVFASVVVFERRFLVPLSPTSPKGEGAERPRASTGRNGTPTIRSRAVSFDSVA